MTTSPSRALLRYHGGKWRLAPWIVAQFPPHAVYLEPFAGAASVLMHKGRCQTEIINDLDGEVINLFRVLQDVGQAAELARLCWLTPFARDEFSLSYEAASCNVERARRYIVRSFFGHGSKSCISQTKNGFRSIRTGDNSPAIDWSRYPDAIADFVSRLRGVVVESMPALDLITRYVRTGALVYLDPPYVHGVRNLEQGVYRHEMSDEDHAELAALARGLDAHVVISGYRTDLYDELYEGWRRVERRAFADMARPRTECLWMNFEVAKMPLLEGL